MSDESNPVALKPRLLEDPVHAVGRTDRRIVGCGRDLGRLELTRGVVEQDDVRKRPSDIDAQSDHGASPPSCARMVPGIASPGSFPGPFGGGNFLRH